MDILNLFDKLTEEEIQETTGIINEQIKNLVDTGKFMEYFPEQEIIYFNTQGFDINLSTIYSKDLEKFETLSDAAQASYPKFAYSVVLNTVQPKQDELEEYVPFRMYIEPHESIDIDEEKEILFLENFKHAVLEIISIILNLLYKKLQLREGTDV